MDTIKIEQHGLTGSVWFAGWLFTVGYLHLSFWHACAALIGWPYHVGAAISSLAR